MLYVSFGTATLIHVTALLVFAWIVLDGRSPGFDLAQVGRVVEERSPDLEDEPLRMRRRELSRDPQRFASRDSSRAKRSAAFLSDRPLQAQKIAEPVSHVLLTRDEVEDPELLSGLGDAVAAPREAGTGESGTGTSTGEGNGGGAAAGSGFFGMKPNANSIVYVVDCSGSMNLPHHSKWKTRFRRLKVEIVRSIGSMSPQQQFYIIFFNDKAIRMPAASMQAAVPRAKQRYLKWMASQEAIGETDPRGALLYAMRLQPEVVYFLTDGSFGAKIQRDLLKLRQDRVAIHTFAFGSKKAEPVMKQIAEANGGKYHYVP